MNSITAIMYNYCDQEQLKGNAQALRQTVIDKIPYSVSGTWRLIVQESIDFVDWFAIAKALHNNILAKLEREARLYEEQTKTNTIYKKTV